MGMERLKATGLCGIPSQYDMKPAVLLWQIHITQATSPEFLKMLRFSRGATTDPLLRIRYGQTMFVKIIGN